LLCLMLRFIRTKKQRLKTIDYEKNKYDETDE